MTDYTDDPLRKAFTHLDERNQLAEQIYSAGIKTGMVRSWPHLEYRCANREGCLLLVAYDTPEGILVHQNGYKLSPEINAAESNESGRRANTRDGVNHWRDRTYFIGSSALADPSLSGTTVHIPAMDGRPASTGHVAGVQLSCDHWRGALDARRFWSDWKARTGRSTVVLLKP
jgi:hypothetical protein